MLTYNFKKNSVLYLVYAGVRYRIDIHPDVNMSQTFTETARKVKTLHSPVNMFDKAIINRASPANFTFTIPLYRESHGRIVYTLATEYDPSYNLNSCDLYFVSDTETYKLETAVFDNLIFQLVKGKVITMNVSGTGRKLTKFVGTIPGTPATVPANKTFTSIQLLRVALDGLERKNVYGVSLELQNEVRWIDYTTLHSTLNVTGYEDTVYPNNYVLSSRTFSGSIQQYITDENGETVNTWNTASAIQIQVSDTKNVASLINNPNYWADSTTWIDANSWEDSIGSIAAGLQPAWVDTATWVDSSTWAELPTNNGALATWNDATNWIDTATWAEGTNGWLIDVNIPEATYTNRLDIQDALLQSFDFRMLTSPESMADVVALA